MRIAFILQTRRDPQSSVFLHYDALATALRDEGHAVSILCPDDVGHGLVRGRWTPVFYPPAAARWLSRAGPFDVVCSHSYAAWFAAAAGLTRRPRTIVVFHGLEPLYFAALQQRTRHAGGALSRRYRLLQGVLMPRMLRAVCRRADVVGCLNRAEAAYLSVQGWTGPDRIVVLPHGVDDAYFSIRRPPRHPSTLLFVGQWLGMKGAPTLRDAFVALAGARPAVRLLCAGTLLDERAVLGEFPESLRTRVTVVPRVRAADLPRVFEAADVFLFPSLYEGFGRAVLEAMASGLPIVTTRVGVAGDALAEGESCLFVPPGDGAGLASAAGRLLDDPELGTRLGERARARAEAYRQERVDAVWKAMLGSGGG